MSSPARPNTDEPTTNNRYALVVQPQETVPTPVPAFIPGSAVREIHFTLPQLLQRSRGQVVLFNTAAGTVNPPNEHLSRSTLVLSQGIQKLAQICPQRAFQNISEWRIITTIEPDLLLIEDFTRYLNENTENSPEVQAQITRMILNVDKIDINIQDIIKTLEFNPLIKSRKMMITCTIIIAVFIVGAIISLAFGICGIKGADFISVENAERFAIPFFIELSLAAIVLIITTENAIEWHKQNGYRNQRSIQSSNTEAALNSSTTDAATASKQVGNDV